MSNQLDKWLKSVDNLAGLPEDEIEARIEALRAEAESIRLKLAVLTQLRPGRSKGRSEPSRSAAPQAVAQPSAAPVADSPSTPPQRRSYGWKRQAVLELIQSKPSKTWSATEIRDGLIANGTMVKEEGTSTRVLLRRLGERGEIQKVGQAAYMSRAITDYSRIPPEFPAPPNGNSDAQQPLAGAHQE